MNDLTSPQFVHLRLHSEYSLRDGLVRVKRLVKEVKSRGMSAVAVTDHANLFSLVKFYKSAIENKIKPIVGADLFLHENDQFFKFTLLCQNDEGYRNLTDLISRAYLHGQQSVGPSVLWEWVVECSEGLIALSGGREGNIGSALLKDDKLLAQEYLARWQVCFPNRFYLDIQRTGRFQEEEHLHAAVALAQKNKIPVVATNDVRFIDRDDFEAHEARVCIHSGYVLQDDKRPKKYSEQQYLRTPEEMVQLFSDIPEAIENTVEIYKRCNLTLELGKVYLPNFPVPEGMTVETFIDQEAQKGLQWRLQSRLFSPVKIKEYNDRLALELRVINNMGFAGYFLIVADFIKWAKQNTIPVGPGRGSGAGSLVAYCLEITDLDPLEHDLLFERFLNPERVSMPDFDIDFCMERRDEVIVYVAEKYGREAVSQIITYGTMAAKAVVRDVGRVLGMPYGFVDKIAKLIPFEIGMTLDKALEQEEALMDRYNNEEEVSTLIDLAKKLEGIARNAGKHAGGVVIAPTKLTDFCPLYCEPGGDNLVTQFDKDDVESVGLVKFDFLGLRTLTIIDWALKKISDKIDIQSIPLNDEKTFQLLNRCETTAVFQLESRGMKELIRRLQPDSFDEITALVALFRPGPLESGMVGDFIDRKHGRSLAYYAHPLLEPILRSTYGVILYQEQVMQIAQVLAGYSLGGADILRRAMGKKKPEEMAKQREIFTQGSVTRGVDKEVAETIFDLMEKFAGYGFNKSHSAAYALIAYQTAWLKAHYPAEFMAAVLSSDMDNTDKVVGFIAECNSMGLKVNPPNVNVGHYMFEVNTKGEIEYGLGAIKGVGQGAIESIVSEREKGGVFKDIFSFVQRVDVHKVNRRALEPLVKSGAFDDFKVHRASLLASINKALKSADQRTQNAERGQMDIFGDVMLPHADTVEKNYVEEAQWNDLTRLRFEKETLGLYLSGHPLQTYESEINAFSTVKINELKVGMRNEPIIVGMIVDVRYITTKMGKRMAVLTIEDQTGRAEVTLFSRLLEEVSPDLVIDSIVVVSGKVENDEYTGGVRMLAEKVSALESLRQWRAQRLFISLKQHSQLSELLDQLPAIIKPFCGGNCPITISYYTNEARAELILGDDWRVSPSSTLVEQLKQMCGDEQVVLEF